MLANYLSNDIDACVLILESLDYTNISHIRHKNELRFSREEGRNPSAVRLSLQTLRFVCFSTNERGNIYTLVMKKNDMNFPQSLRYVANKLGLEKSRFSNKIKYPFSGFYRGLVNEVRNPELKTPIYEDCIMSDYLGKYSLMFLKDGIDFDTQRHFIVHKVEKSHDKR